MAAAVSLEFENEIASYRPHATSRTFCRLALRSAKQTAKGQSNQLEELAAQLPSLSYGSPHTETMTTILNFKQIAYLWTYLECQP